MKTLIAPAVVAFAAAIGIVPQQGIAADDHHGHGHHDTMHAPSSAETPLVEGLVKKVDKAAGKVTVSHGPLPNGMPAMTMAFRVKDPAWIDNMSEGQKIRFAVQQIEGAMTLVRIDLMK